ncbi:MAG: type II toxin-antitoxin system RelE/ParE family toxin [Selenomonas ruminantium]|uniref:Type II toxin-antitoxin system RelE/ParE family toxin n=2 Tax=Selenomonas ruminantium TaxID=971 RepID=A0A927ZPT1_SELRU|nr:type II toxin-antitoxin system RelE/ParE family toxin [Selenomonas ruminantium]
MKYVHSLTKASKTLKTANPCLQKISSPASGECTPMIEYQVIISEQAAKDISDIYDYIYSVIGMPQIAMNQFNRIADAIDTLRLFPERIKIMTDAKRPEKEFRQLLVDNYSVIFTIHEKTVNISRVAYSPSNIANKLVKL